MKILITGGTGFLGPSVIAEVLKQFGSKTEVTLVSRKKLPPSESVKHLVCDLTNWNGGLEADVIEALIGKFDVMLHMAGLYNLRVSKEDAYLNNVFATHTALALAQRLQIPVFAHVSTVAVTMGHGDLSLRQSSPKSEDTLIGRPQFFNSPEGLSDLQKTNGIPISASLQSRGPFPDAYAESKANGEKTVRAWDADYPKRKLILRPGILIGKTDGTAIGRIDGPYHAIDAFRRLRPLIEAWRGTIMIPGRKNHTIPLVPVDCAAKAITLLLASFLKSEAPTSSYYVAPATGPTVEALFKSALENLGLHREVRAVETIPGSLVKPLAEWVARLPREEIEYVLNLPSLDTSESDAILGEDFYPRFKEYEAALWKGYHAYIQSR